MPEIVFSDCEKAITENEWRLVEKELGVALPVFFKSHYLQYNGGELEGSILKDKTGCFKNLEDFRFIPMLYAKSFKNDPLFSIPGRTKEEWKKNEVPKDLLPFAFEAMGDYLCINPASGKIYFFERNTHKPVPIFICDSFQAFLENIEQMAPNEEVYLYRHKFWGQIKETLIGFSINKLFTIPQFGEDGIEIFFGEEFDGDEDDGPPTPKQLNNYEKTFTAFLQNIAAVVEAIKNKTFEYYQKYYAHQYKDNAASGEEPAAINTPEAHFEYVKDINYIRILKRQTIQISIQYGLDREHGVEIKLQKKLLRLVELPRPDNL